MAAFSGYGLLLLLNFANSASNRRCFPLRDRSLLCFTQPDPPVALSWSDAMEWCKNIGATLPTQISSDRLSIYGNAVGYFGLSTETLWLGANSTYDPNNWYWASGTRFTGTVENGNISGKTHAYVVRNGTNIKFVADSPFNSNHHICREQRYSELDCAYSPESYWTDEKCYRKYRYRYSWYSYWSTCGATNRASYDDVKKFYRWLDNLQPFWVDLSCTWWTWQDTVTGRSYEITENRFRNGWPRVTSAQCLASYTFFQDWLQNNNAEIWWINRECQTNLQFICQQYVNITTTTTSTSSTPTTSTTSSSTTVTTTPTSTTFTTVTTTPISTASTSANTTFPATSSTNVMTTPTFTASTTATTTLTSTDSTSVTTTPTSTASTTATNTPIFMTSITPTIKSSNWWFPKSSTIQTANIPSFPKSNIESNPANNGLVIGLCVGFSGGLFLVVTVWLALLTVYAYRNIRYAKQSAGNPATISTNACNNYTFSDESGRAEMQEADAAYEALELEAK